MSIYLTNRLRYSRERALKGLVQGHFFVLSKLLNISKSKSLESVLLTFHPHPRNVLFSDAQELKLLNTIGNKKLENTLYFSVDSRETINNQTFLITKPL